VTANEAAIRKAYQVAEDKDIAGSVDCFTKDGTFTDESIGVTYRGLPRALLEHGARVRGSCPKNAALGRRSAASHVCSDYPSFRRDLAVGRIAALRHTEELAASEREAVLGGNALKLFPRLADGSASASSTSPRL